MPIPLNVAFPTGNRDPTATDTAVMMPPPIPPAPAVPGPGLLRGLADPAARVRGDQRDQHAGTGNIPPALSNATDSGDPWINNLVANQQLNPGSPSVPTYTLNHGFTSLMWAGGSYYPNAAGTAPL